MPEHLSSALSLSPVSPCSFIGAVHEQVLLFSYMPLRLRFIYSFWDIVSGRGDPFQGLKLGSCLTLGNELSEDTHMLTKQDILSGKGTWARAGGWGNPGEQFCHMARSLGFYGDGIHVRVVFSQSFWLRVLPGSARLVHPRWMPERRILGGGWTCAVSFWPFPISSGWWWLTSSLLIRRTSCRKTAHGNGYYGVWPWAVPISVLPLTVIFLF